jgi:ferritin-like metal-binding protein YciE
LPYILPKPITLEGEMAMENLQELFEHEIKDLYSAEKQLVKALPRMAKAAASEELATAFEEHLGQTEEHVARLEKILGELDASTNRVPKCKGMEGLIEEGKEILEDDVAEHVIDAALIGAAQRVEHYEIAAYGTARALALELGMDKAAKLLQKTLDEESAADRKLTEIAETLANERAEMGEAEEVES